ARCQTRLARLACTCSPQRDGSRQPLELHFGLDHFRPVLTGDAVAMALRIQKMMNRRPAPSEPCPRGLLALIFLSWAARVCSGAESIVLVSGNVYTADDRNPRAQVVVAAHGRILYVG